MEKPDHASAKSRAEAAVEIVGLQKWYGEFHVLRDINLAVARGERIVICGPSGGGKSTLLRCVNRLEDWQRGRVVVDGIELTDDPKQILAVRRNGEHNHQRTPARTSAAFRIGQPQHVQFSGRILF